MIKKGQIQIYTGSGKGKTTAAMGQALRILSYGGKVCIIQFFKPKQSGEIRFLKKSFSSQVGVYNICGTHPFFLSEKARKVSQKDKNRCDAQWLSVKNKVFGQTWDLVIFDEINIALKDKFISLSGFLKFLRQKPRSQEWILTGRGALSQVIKEASLVTELEEIKHPFLKGVKKRKGIEY